MPVADTLLRLAEEPAFYTPRWSVDILQEVERTLQKRLHYTAAQIDRRITAMRTQTQQSMDTMILSEQ